MIVFIIQVKFYFATVVVDNMVSIGIGPWPFRKDPCVVYLGSLAGWVSRISCTLNNQELLIHVDLPNMAVCH